MQTRTWNRIQAPGSLSFEVKADSGGNDEKREDVETKKELLGWGPGNSLDYNSATWQNHQTPSSLKDTDKGLTHIPKLFAQDTDPHRMKTADHKHTDPRLVETRRLMMLETSPWCQPFRELPTSWPRPAPWTL